MKDYPKYVRLGQTEMELLHTDDEYPYYWREHGAWGVHAKWVGTKLITHDAPMEHLKNQEFTILSGPKGGPMNYEEYRVTIDKAIREAEAMKKEGIITGRCPNYDGFGFGAPETPGNHCKQCPVMGECNEARAWYKENGSPSNRARFDYLSGRRSGMDAIKKCEGEFVVKLPKEPGFVKKYKALAVKCLNNDDIVPGPQCEYCTQDEGCDYNECFGVEPEIQDCDKEYCEMYTKCIIKFNKKGSTMTDVKQIGHDIMENGAVAIADTKEIMVRAQVGAATLTAVKAALAKLPLPQGVKDVMAMPGYGDLAVGFLLNAVAPSITNNDKVKDAVHAANMVGTFRASEEITVIQDVINGIVEGVLGASASVMSAINVEAEVADEESRGE